MRLVLTILAAAFLAPASALLYAAPAKASAAAQVAPGCGDFLAQLHRKPAHLTYVACRAMPDRQGKPLRATYRVGGRDAAMVEAYLVRTVGLNRLKRSCCQWDSLPHEFKDPGGREFSIAMVSQETRIASRAAWGRIATFEITVETLTEDV